MPLARIFVLVPTKVQQPPKIEAYETGISIFEEETPIVRERLITTGSNTTTTGVLFTKADTKATSANKININLRYPYLQNFPK